MNLAVLKLCDVAARALFTVGAAFLLPVEQGGQFGLSATMAGLFAFAFGWERHIDLQRRFAGREQEIIDRAVASLPRMWLFNYVVMAPLLFLLGIAMASLDTIAAGMLVVIAIAEQHANAVYNLSVMEQRYRPMVVVATARSLALVVAVAALWLTDTGFTLTAVLLIWSVSGLVASFCMALLWARLVRPGDREPTLDNLPETGGIFAQHSASLVHFLIGGLAVIAIQIDRLVVGALLPMAEVGIYFRHVLVVSFAYQFFNVASFNRRVAAIFASARGGDFSTASRIIGGETRLIWIAAVAALAGLLLVGASPLASVLDTLHLQPLVLAVLIGGTLTRINADFDALLLNARFRERKVLGNQAVAVAVGATTMAILTVRYGLIGTAWGTVAAAVVYAILNRLSNSSIRKQQLP